MIHDDYDRSLAHSLSRATLVFFLLSERLSRPETAATIKAHQAEKAMRGAAETQASLNNNS